jgi:transposase
MCQTGKLKNHSQQERGVIMKITRMGIDLAKNVFQLHGVNAAEKVVYQKALKRKEVLTFFTQQEPMLIGMEACGGAHYWARELSALGHDVRIMAPQHVKAYVKTHKNDKRDAEAICEAVSRPTMRFVEIKSIEQQDMQAVHRIRERLIKSRIALTNEMRGLLMESGISIDRLGFAASRTGMQEALENADNGLSENLRMLLQDALEELSELSKRIARYEDKIIAHVAQDDRVKRLMEIEGVGPITASAIVTAVGNASHFKNGREMAAWLGLVPNQHSSGGKEKMGGISKRGDRRLRTLLIHGGRAVVQHCEKKTDYRSEWIKKLIQRRNKNVAAVAVANKNARIIWAILRKDEPYRKPIHAKQEPLIIEAA